MAPPPSTARPIDPDEQGLPGGAMSPKMAKGITPQAPASAAPVASQAALNPQAAQAASQTPEGGSTYANQMANVGRLMVDAPVRALKTIVSAPGYGLNQEPAQSPASATPLAASYSNEGRRPSVAAGISPVQAPAAQAMAVTATSSLGSGKDVGFGVTRFDGGSSPLFTNMTDAAGMASNQQLMGRGAVSPQNQMAMDALAQRGAQERAQQRQVQQYQAEVAQAQSARQQSELQRIEAAERKMGIPLGKARRAQLLADTQVASASRDQARLGLDAMRLGDEMQNSASRRAAIGVDMERTGMDMAKAKQIDAARQEYLAAGDDPAKQKAAARKLAVLSGRDSQGEWGIHVTPATKNVDGTTNEGSIYRFNKATGQAERVDVGPPAGAAKSSQKYTVDQTVQRPDGQQARVTAVDENGKPTKFQTL